jgi:hypothetical protein
VATRSGSGVGSGLLRGPASVLVISPSWCPVRRPCHHLPAGRHNRCAQITVDERCVPAARSS